VLKISSIGKIAQGFDLLNELVKHLEVAISTASGVAFDLPPGVQGNTVVGSVKFTRHPKDFSEESPGVAFVINRHGINGIRVETGFFENWRQAGEGTQFSKSISNSYSVNPGNIQKISSDIINKAVEMLISSSGHDIDSYSEDAHQAEWNRIESNELA